MNLWQETIDTLTEYGKTWNDVVEIRGNKFRISKENFEELAKDTNYDNGYGSQKIAYDLKIYGANWWLERGEYDGREWWEFHTIEREMDMPLVTVESLCCGYHNYKIGWSSLEALNEKGGRQ